MSALDSVAPSGRFLREWSMDDDGAVDVLGELDDDAGEGGLILGRHGIGARAERGPGVDDEERDALAPAGVPQPGDVRRFHEVEVRPDHEPKRAPARGRRARP
jgi:hypothetical protein